MLEKFEIIKKKEKARIKLKNLEFIIIVIKIRKTKLTNKNIRYIMVFKIY